MHDSSFSSWFCALSDLLVLCSAASTCANSFASVSSHATFLVGIILETNDQLPGFDFGPEMKDRSDSNTARVIASTSLNLLTMATVSRVVVKRRECGFAIDSLEILHSLLDCLFNHLPGAQVFVNLTCESSRFTSSRSSYDRLKILYVCLGLQDGILGSAANVQESERAI